jgi:hypothetical protein
VWRLVCGQEETGCRTYIFELLHLIRQPLCVVPRHAVGEADCSVSRDVGVGRVVRVRDAGVGDGAVMSNRGRWRVLDCLSSCLLQARRVLRAKLRFRQVDAWLSRIWKGRPCRICLCIPTTAPSPAVFGVMLLSPPLGYARLRSYVEAGWGGGQGVVQD